MGILHRDCAMQRDRPSLFVRGNGDLHIDRYILHSSSSLLHFATLDICMYVCMYVGTYTL